jgi:hypothetical protein
MSSAVTFTKALYSESVLDHEIVACYLELHDIKLDPRKIAKPHVDFLSFGHPVQSAYENPLRTKDDDLINLNP